MKILFLILFTWCLNINLTYSQAKKHLNENAQTEYNLNLVEGEKNKLLGYKDLAIINFSKCIELAPKSPVAYYQLADIYQSIGEKNKALFFSEQCCKLDENNIWYLQQLGGLYQSFGKFDSTIRIYKKLTKLNPGKEEYVLNLAFLFFKKNKINESIDVLNKYKEKHVLTPNIALTLFQILSYKKNYKECIKILKEGLTQFRDESQFYGLLAETYVTINEMDSAYVYYKKLIELEPDSEKGLLSLIEFYKIKSDTLQILNYTRKYLFLSNASFPDKVALLSSMVNDPKYLILVKDSIEFLVKELIDKFPEGNRLNLLLVDFYVNTKNLTQAKELLKTLIEKYSANYAVWEQLLVILNSLNNSDELITYALQAEQIFPEKPLPFYFHSLGLYLKNDYKSIEEPLLKAFDLSKNDSRIHVQVCSMLGEVYQKFENYAKSSYYFERALQLDPNNILVLNNYSYYLSLRNDNLSNALKYSKICIDKVPNSSTYLDTYAWILFKMNKWQEALPYIKKAYTIAGNKNQEIIEHYSEILYYNGKLELAKETLQNIPGDKIRNIELKRLLQIE